MTRDEIQAEFDSFIEYPGKDKTYVTTVSTLLFAEHIAKMAQETGRAQGLREAREAVQKRYMGDNNREDAEVLRCAAAIQQLEGRPR